MHCPARLILPAAYKGRSALARLILPAAYKGCSPSARLILPRRPCHGSWLCFEIKDTFKYMVMSHAFHNCCECPEDRRTGFEPIIFRFTCNCSTLLCLLYESLTGSVLFPLNYRRIFNCCKCSVNSRGKISTAGIKWTCLSH